MGILKGAMSVRRYRIVGEAPEDFRDRYIGALNEHAFKEPASKLAKEEHVGWCLSQNLLDVAFDDINKWLYNHYALFSLRVDKKVLPATYFRAHLQKRQQAWCAANSRERVPAAVKTELKDLLEAEMMLQTLPRVAVTEAVWNIQQGWALFHSGSEVANDRFRKLFHRTFGLIAVPFDPIDFVADLGDVAQRLASTGASDLREFQEA
jgi:DNA recombination-dependent growth factor C